MIAVEPLRNFLELLIWTGCIDDERPVSAILIAPAGAGKTSMLETLTCERTALLSDITARELSVTLRQKPNISHVLLQDMNSLFSHRKSVVALTCSMLSGLTGETLRTDSFDGQGVTRQLGMITAITPADLKRHAVKAQLQTGGFATRFLILKYLYAPSTITKIHKYIERNGYAKETIESIDVGNDKWRVTIPIDLSSEINAYAQAIKTDELGFRTHRHLRALIKAEARRNERNTATIADLEYVRTFCDFLAEGKVL